MNAMTNFTLRSLAANRVRTLVTVAGVALAAALLTAVLTTYFSLTDFLYRSEAALAGTWMAYVDGEGSEAFDDQIAQAKDDPSVTGMTVVRDVGFAGLTEEQQRTQGAYVPLLSVSGDAETVAGIRPSEGRLPEKPGEIMLFATWKESEGVELGSQITFPVGERVAVLAPGKEGSMTAGSTSVGLMDGNDVGEMESEVTDGASLNSSMGYLDAETDGGIFNERLENATERTYTVVGFYERPGYVLSAAVGAVGVVADEASPDAFTDVLLTMTGVSNTDEVKACAERLFPDRHVVLHTAMLRYMGVTSDAGIWDTFFGIVVVLASVIALACVSLIYNAFNISVAERVRQFGLLSSVGASRRQLRRAVVLEGLLVACAGIPLGLVIGLAGCAVTFAALGPALASLAGGGEVPFRVAVNGLALGAAAVLTLVTVLVSVWIPAKRASLTNIIDALRNTGSTRISRRGVRDAEKSVRGGRLWRERGLAGRLFGLGGTLARTNRRRGATKGRAASVSLALAIVLLMTAGSLNAFLGSLVGVVSGGAGAAGEVAVTAQFNPASRSEPKDGEAGDVASAAGEAGAAATPEGLLAQTNARFAAEAAEFSDAYQYLAETPNAQGKGFGLAIDAPVILPAAMVGDALQEEGAIEGGRLADGRYGTVADIVYVDDASFDAYARDLGLDPADFRDAEHPRAIGLAQGYGNNGDVYQLLDILREAGTVDVLASGTYEGRPVSLGLSMTATDSEGGSSFEFIPYVRDEGSDGVVNESLSLDDVDMLTVPLEVATVTDQVPAVLAGPGSGVHLIVPVSLAAAQGFGTESPIFSSYFDPVDGDHAALTEALASRGGEFFHDCPFETAFYSYNDFVEQADSTQMLATVVNVFCLLFTVILALIVMANVFNTVTNSLILRRREFAVMKSVGLSNRQFRSMIAEECTHFGIGGLVPGLIISVGVSYLLYTAVTQSMSGLPFTLPWGYVALALGMTAAAMGISVAYGMHRCKADNVVEALRTDGV